MEWPVAMSVYSASERLVGMLRQDRTGNALQDRVAQLFEESREDVYRYLLETDYAIKTGRIEPVLALDLLVTSLAA